MSQTIVIGARDNLLETVLEHLECASGDLSDQVVVFPGKRPAHFLRKLISNKIGSSFRPPKICSIETFIDFLVQNYSHETNLQLTNLDAAALLYEIHSREQYALGGGAFQSFAHFLPIGFKLFQEFEEVLLGEVQPKKFRELIASYPYGRMQAMSNYFEQFYREVESRHRITRAQQYQRAASIANTEPLREYRSIIVAGFFALTKTEQRLFRSLRQKENVLFLFQRAESDYDPWNEKSSSDNEATLLAPKATFTFTKAPDSHGQLFALAEKLRTASHPFDESTVIVLPDSQTLFPLIHQALPALGDADYNISLGYPLIRTPLYGFLYQLLTTIISMRQGKISAAQYIRFLLHPYCKNIRFGTRTDVTRILVHTIEESLSSNPSLNYCSLEEIEEKTELFDDVLRRLDDSKSAVSADELREHLITIHNNTLRRMLGIQNNISLETLANELLSILTYIHDSSTARLHPYFTPYVERLHESLEELRDSLIAQEHFSKPEEYGLFLKHFLETISVPFPGTPLKGLQILGLLETRNIAFRTVYLLNANEGVLPPTGEMPLIPQEVRAKLGLETIRDREKLIEQYIQLLFHGAEEVHIFFSESSSGKQNRSRTIHKLLWQKEQEAGKMCADEFVHNVQYTIQLSTQTPAPIQKTKKVVELLQAIHFSATMLDTYLRCPLKFFYSFVLGLEEPDTVPEELGAEKIGLLIHNALNTLFQPFVRKKLSVEVIDALDYEYAVDRAFKSFFGAIGQGRSLLIRDQILKQVHAFLQDYQRSILKESSIEILSLEDSVKLAHQSVVFRSRFDRVENRDGKIWIIDYKTSANENRYRINLKKLDPNDRATRSKSIGSLQLPLYVLLYSTLHKVSLENLSAAYLFLGKQRIDTSIEVPLYNSSEETLYWQPQLEALIYSLIEEIRSPDVPFRPAEDFTKECIYCPMQTLCGTQWIKEWNS